MQFTRVCAGQNLHHISRSRVLTLLPIVAYDEHARQKQARKRGGDMKMRMFHGPAVRAIREALGIKHGKFAVDCGISPGYLTNIEKGKKQPSETVITAIATRLGVTKDEITYTVTADATKNAA